MAFKELGTTEQVNTEELSNHVIYIPISMAQGFQFLYNFGNIFFPLFCDSVHPNGCEALSHCGFDLHFSA